MPICNYLIPNTFGVNQYPREDFFSYSHLLHCICNNKIFSKYVIVLNVHGIDWYTLQALYIVVQQKIRWSKFNINKAADDGICITEQQ